MKHVHHQTNAKHIIKLVLKFRWWTKHYIYDFQSVSYAHEIYVNANADACVVDRLNSCGSDTW